MLIKNFRIAIDGHAASGKGTIAKSVADHFGLSYLDTGLIYRAVAQLALLKGNNSLARKDLIDIARSFKFEYLELKNLRSSEVGVYASKIAALPEIRSELIKFQKNFASRDKGAVLDGRDIGSVILPDADLKIFVTAHQSIRAQRRFEELKKFNDSITLPQVLEDLSKRDWLDTTRENAPLKLSSDAHLIDTTELSIEASIASVIKLAEEVRMNVRKNF